MMDSYIRIDCYLDKSPDKPCIIIDRPLCRIQPGSLVHSILNWIHSNHVVDKLRSDNVKNSYFTPYFISKGLDKLESKFYLYPLLEKMWMAGLLEKRIDFDSLDWWWTKYSLNYELFECLEVLNSGNQYQLVND